jgi:hypothetical protein
MITGDIIEELYFRFINLGCSEDTALVLTEQVALGEQVIITRDLEDDDYTENLLDQLLKKLKYNN